MLLFYNISFSQIVYREQFFFWDLSLLYCHFSLFVFIAFQVHINISVIYQYWEQEVKIIFSCSKSWLRFFFLIWFSLMHSKGHRIFLFYLCKNVFVISLKKARIIVVLLKLLTTEAQLMHNHFFKKVEKALPSLSYLVYPLLHDPYFTLHNLWRNMKIKQRPNGFLGKIQF